MFVNGFDEEMADYCCVADWKAIGRMALVFHGNDPSIFPGNFPIIISLLPCFIYLAHYLNYSIKVHHLIKKVINSVFSCYHFPLEVPEPTAWQVRTYSFVKSRYYYHPHGGIRPLPIYLLPAEVWEWLESSRYRLLKRSFHNCQLEDAFHQVESSTSI